MRERAALETFILPDLGSFDESSGLIRRNQTGDGRFTTGRNGVRIIAATGDEKVELIGFESHTLAYVKSALDYPAYYPVHPVFPEKPVQAVLMAWTAPVFAVRALGLDHPTNLASLKNDPHFELEESDLPYISGHSVSGIYSTVDKYCQCFARNG